MASSQEEPEQAMAISQEEPERQFDTSQKLQNFLDQFPTASLNVKANTLGKELVDFLMNHPDAIDSYDEISNLTEGLGLHWVLAPNPKVTQYGLEALTLIAEALQGKYKSCCAGVMSQVITRLGDTKESIREKARSYFITTVQVGASSAGFMIEKMLKLLNHKNPNVIIEAQRVILATLNVAQNLNLSADLTTKLVKAEASGLGNHGREEAETILLYIVNNITSASALVVAEMEREAGKPGASSKRATVVLDAAKDLRLQQLALMTPVQKPQGPPKRQAPSVPRHVAPVRVEAPPRQEGLQSHEQDERDCSIEEPNIASTSAVRSQARPGQGSSALPSATPPAPRPHKLSERLTDIATGVVRKTSQMFRTGAARRDRLADSSNFGQYSGKAGDCDRVWFETAFEDVPKVVVLTKGEYEILIKSIENNMKPASEFWERKVDALKKIRSMVIYLTGWEDNVASFIKGIYLQLIEGLRDLRSQIVRETYLTIAFICLKMKNKFDPHTIECLLPPMLLNTMSSAKIVVQATDITLEYMFQNVTHSVMLKVLCKEMTSTKSMEVRKQISKVLEQVMGVWPVRLLEANSQLLQELIRRGVRDCTSEGRVHARKAFLLFQNHFPAQGTELLQSLDASTRSKIDAEILENKQGTSTSTAKSPKPKAKQTTTARHGPAQREEENEGSPQPTRGGEPKARTYGFRRKLVSCIPVPVGNSHAPDSLHRQAAKAPVAVSKRSNSAIDIQAVHRANARQQYAALGRQKVGGLASLPRAKKTETDQSQAMPSTSGSTEVERLSRDRTRIVGVSQSTPGSRSGSPSSTRSPGYDPMVLYQGRKGSPRSRNSSRETSPIRLSSKTGLISVHNRRTTAMVERSPHQSAGRPVMAQRLLAQSLEAEEKESLYDADSDTLGHKVSPRKTSYRPFEDHSDDSDASSLCSERSFDSYRRTSDSYSWSGSQQRLYRDVWESGTKDINEILVHCGSTAWSDRKEGLVGLQAWLQAGNTLDPTQLKLITDCFTKMFMDSHTKIFSLFLDTLNELLVVHRADLNSWLYILLTRLLNKLGGDLLGSIQNKIQKSLNTVRESFPPELQMLSLLRFLTDHTQTPNLRVKTAALNYITKLAAITDPSQAFPQMSPGSSRDPVQAALHKMIGWTMGDGIKQGNELRRAAQEAILALFNLNTPQVTVRLANLPQEYQEAAASLLKQRVRRGSNSSINAISLAPPSPSSRLPRLRTNDPDSSLNAEDVYKSGRESEKKQKEQMEEQDFQKNVDVKNERSFFNLLAHPKTFYKAYTATMRRRETDYENYPAPSPSPPPSLNQDVSAGLAQSLSPPPSLSPAPSPLFRGFRRNIRARLSFSHLNPAKRKDMRPSIGTQTEEQDVVSRSTQTPAPNNVTRSIQTIITCPPKFFTSTDV